MPPSWSPSTEGMSGNGWTERTTSRTEDPGARIAQAAEGNGRMRIGEIARYASVSRQFICRHADLVSAINDAAPSADAAAKERPVGSTALDGLRADNRTLTATVERQRQVIADLRGTIGGLQEVCRRWLGTQLAAQDQASVEDVLELRLTCDRLTSRNNAVTDEVADLRRVIANLESDLSASREAHRQDVAERSPVGSTRSSPEPSRPPGS